MTQATVVPVPRNAAFGLRATLSMESEAFRKRQNSAARWQAIPSVCRRGVGAALAAVMEIWGAQAGRSSRGILSRVVNAPFRIHPNIA